MSKVVSLLHIVINTKFRHPTIEESNKRILYSFIYGILKRHRCFLYRMNGISNHIHMLIDLHQSIALSDIMLEIKRESSRWMKQSGLFPLFDGWGREYAAFSCSYREKDGIIEYIKSQEVHHRVTPFEDELHKLYDETGQEWNEYALT